MPWTYLYPNIDGWVFARKGKSEVFPCQEDPKYDVDGEVKLEFFVR